MNKFLFGLALLLVGACSSNNGTVSANQSTTGAGYYVRTQITDTGSSDVFRVIDCKNHVAIYTYRESIAVYNVNVNGKLYSEECQ